MTPIEKLHQNQRVWTPRLLTASTVLGALSFILWFFVSGWIIETKTGISNIQTKLESISIQYEGRIAKVETRLDNHDMRLAVLER